MRDESTPLVLPPLNSPDHPLYPYSEQVFIYALVDRRTDRIRYVGRSRDPIGRLQQHLGTARSGKRGDLYVWLRSCLHFQSDPLIKILDVCHRDEMDEVEREWITKIGTIEPTLLNIMANAQYVKRPGKPRNGRVRKHYHLD